MLTEIHLKSHKCDDILTVIIFISSAWSTAIITHHECPLKIAHFVYCYYIQLQTHMTRFFKNLF